MSAQTLHPVPTVAEALPALREIVETKSHRDLPGGLLVDLFSASAIVQVHDALNDTNRARLAGMDLLTGQTFVFLLLDKASKR